MGRGIRIKKIILWENTNRRKTPIHRGNCQKSGAWTVFKFKKGLGKKMGWCF